MSKKKNVSNYKNKNMKLSEKIIPLKSSKECITSNKHVRRLKEWSEDNKL